MDDRGDAEYILGMLIERDRVARTLKLTQTQYSDDCPSTLKRKRI